MNKYLENLRKSSIEKIGVDFDLKNVDDFAGLSINNPIFKEVISWIENDYKFVVIEKGEEDRFRFEYRTQDGSTIFGPFNSIKSFGTRLFDVALVMPNYKELLYKKGNVDSVAIDYFIDRKISIDELKKFWNDKEAIFNYWKSLSFDENYFTQWIAKRIRTIYYGRLKPFLNPEEYLDVVDSYVLKDQNRLEELNRIVESIINDAYREIEFTSKVVDIPRDRTLAIEFDARKTFYPKTIAEIIKSVELDQIIVPVFQRDYVWKAKNIISLLNSIYKGYPIGSLLLAKTDINFEQKNVIISSISRGNSKLFDKFLLLDGQQRLSSLFLIFAYEDLSRISMSGITNNDEILRDCLNYLKDIYFLDQSNTGEECFFDKKTLIEEYKIAKSDLGKYSITNENIRNKVFEKLYDYKISMIVMDKIDSTTLVEVFEKINTGNTKLTKLDLLHAAFFAQNNKLNLLDTINQLLKDEIISDFCVGSELIIQCWKMEYDYSQNFECKISWNKIMEIGFDKNKTDNFFGLITRCQTHLKSTIKLLNNILGWTNKNSMTNISFFLATYAYVMKNISGDSYKQFDSKAHEEVLLKIYKILIVKSFRRIYSSGTAKKVESDVREIISEDFLKNNTDICEREDFKLEREFESADYVSKNIIYNLFIGHLVLKSPLSLVNGLIKVRADIAKWTDINNDQHHFLPKTYEKNVSLFKDIIDLAPNIVLISEEENRKVIGTLKPPKYFLMNVEENNSMDISIDRIIENVEESHGFEKGDLKFIHKNDNVTNEDYIRIWENRKKKIVKELKKKFDFLE